MSQYHHLRKAYALRHDSNFNYCIVDKEKNPLQYFSSYAQMASDLCMGYDDRLTDCNTKFFVECVANAHKGGELSGFKTITNHCLSPKCVNDNCIQARVSKVERRLKDVFLGSERVAHYTLTQMNILRKDMNENSFDIFRNKVINAVKSVNKRKLKIKTDTGKRSKTIYLDNGYDCLIVYEFKYKPKDSTYTYYKGGQRLTNVVTDDQFHIHAHVYYFTRYPDYDTFTDAYHAGGEGFTWLTTSDYRYDKKLMKNVRFHTDQQRMKKKRHMLRYACKTIATVGLVDRKRFNTKTKRETGRNIPMETEAFLLFTFSRRMFQFYGSGKHNNVNAYDEKTGSLIYVEKNIYDIIKGAIKTSRSKLDKKYIRIRIMTINKSKDQKKPPPDTDNNLLTLINSDKFGHLFQIDQETGKMCFTACEELLQDEKYFMDMSATASEILGGSTCRE